MNFVPNRSTSSHFEILPLRKTYPRYDLKALQILRLALMSGFQTRNYWHKYDWIQDLH